MNTLFTSIISKYAVSALLVVFVLHSSVVQASSSTGDSQSAVTTVVIDAGHGGHDAGCSGKHSKEKHVALDIALRLGTYIEEKIPGVKVIYTRKTDVFIELHERAAIANRANADVFISIHCNANGATSAYGTETYVMGLHKNSANLDVAKRENDVVLLEDNYNSHYDGFDPNSATAHIIFTLFQHAYLGQSISLASKIEDQFAKRVSRKSRGVKQAGFLVLYKTTMPSVLIETGFLSNIKEENFLDSDNGKDLMASAIFRAFRDYKVEMDAKLKHNVAEEPARKKDPIVEAPITGPEPATAAVDIEKYSTAPSKKIEISTKPVATGKEIQTPSPLKNQVYRVQILASMRKYKASDQIFKSLGKTEELFIIKDPAGIYKYMVGEFHNPGDASLLKDRLRKAEFPDAFVISQQASDLANR
ncbi:MAG: N-acetylmuramoyl-L-alanine amidase [Limisphaerales bacterium]|jgi:N-acetylmuramoyl-L-alanine amidase